MANRKDFLVALVEDLGVAVLLLDQGLEVVDFAGDLQILLVLHRRNYRRIRQSRTSLAEPRPQPPHIIVNIFLKLAEPRELPPELQSQLIEHPLRLTRSLIIDVGILIGQHHDMLARVVHADLVLLQFRAGVFLAAFLSVGAL